MATESVDEILWSIEADYRPGESKAVDTRIAEAKQRLQAYYTRECARKVLEAKVEQTELIRDEWGKWLAFPDDDPHEKTEIRHIVTHCNELIAELRAAIEEVGGAMPEPQQTKPSEEK